VTNHEYRFGGCEGLKNIYFVVKSALWPQKVGKIDPTAVFRPATSTGVTKAQVTFYAEREHQIQMAEDEVELGELGGNVWVGEQKPTISLASFSKTRGGRGMEVIRFILGPVICTDEDIGGGYGGGSQDRILLALSSHPNPVQKIAQDLVFYGRGNQGGYGGSLSLFWFFSSC
jgi:hypothetical protein